MVKVVGDQKENEGRNAFWSLKEEVDFWYLTGEPILKKSIALVWGKLWKTRKYQYHVGHDAFWSTKEEKRKWMKKSEE